MVVTAEALLSPIGASRQAGQEAWQGLVALEGYGLAGPDLEFVDSFGDQIFGLAMRGSVYLPDGDPQLTAPAPSPLDIYAISRLATSSNRPPRVPYTRLFKPIPQAPAPCPQHSYSALNNFRPSLSAEGKAAAEESLSSAIGQASIDSLARQTLSIVEETYNFVPVGGRDIDEKNLGAAILTREKKHRAGENDEIEERVGILLAPSLVRAATKVLVGEVTLADPKMSSARNEIGRKALALAAANAGA